MGMNDSPDSIRSVRDLLVDTPQSAKEHVDKHLDVMVTLPPLITREQVIEAVLGVLDVPFSDVILPAWEQYTEVRRAMTETRDKPRLVQHVRIGSHTLTSKHRPSVECDLDGQKLFELEFDLELSLHFIAADVTVARGEITSIRPGEASVAASLKTASGVPLLPERKLLISFPEAITGREEARRAVQDLAPAAHGSQRPA